MNTDKRGLLYADITYKVRKAIFNVYNELGYGHKELVYQKALVKELDELKIFYKREKDIDVFYKGKVVGNYRPDFIIEDKVIVEIKAVVLVPKVFEIQLLHYLKATGYKLGLLVNFGTQRLFIKRLILTK